MTIQAQRQCRLPECGDVDPLPWRWAAMVHRVEDLPPDCVPTILQLAGDVVDVPFGVAALDQSLYVLHHNHHRTELGDVLQGGLGGKEQRAQEIDVGCIASDVYT